MAVRHALKSPQPVHVYFVENITRINRLFLLADVPLNRMLVLDDVTHARWLSPQY